MLELNRIYQGDCLDLLLQLDDNSVDLVLTDPPYNIGKDFENDNLPQKEYLEWCKKWISELVRVCKVGGAIYLTLGFQCVAEIKVIFNRFETLRLKNWIVWYRQDGWKGDKGFAHSHEHILYFIKDNVPLFDLQRFGESVKRRRLNARYKTVAFLMEAMGLYTKIKRKDGSEDYRSGNGWFESGKKKPTLNELIRLNHLIGLDAEFKRHLEPIFKDRLAFRDYLNEMRIKKGLSLTDINKRFGWATTGGGVSSAYFGNKSDNLIPSPNHYMLLKELLGLDNRYDDFSASLYLKFNKTDVCDDVWLTPKSEKKRLGHPTQKPEALFRRIIKVSSNKGDVVLDPFSGSGTTCIVSQQCERQYIGFELNPEYVEIANRRLRQESLSSIPPLESHGDLNSRKATKGILKEFL